MFIFTSVIYVFILCINICVASTMTLVYYIWFMTRPLANRSKLNENAWLPENMNSFSKHEKDAQYILLVYLICGQ